MRREGYELQVGRPHVIFKEIDGKRCEPFEFLVIDVPQVSEGRVIELVTQRKGHAAGHGAQGRFEAPGVCNSVAWIDRSA
jgi:predicted membrane GTPase involved in stress response